MRSHKKANKDCALFNRLKKKNRCQHLLMKVYLNADFAAIELFNKKVERFFNSLFGYDNS